MINRRKTRQVRVGALTIGSDAPISIQSMTKTDTKDIDATLEQIRMLATAGCEIIRIAVPTIKDAEALTEIRRGCPAVPLVADIHFHAQFAIAAIEAGFDKIRWNPGNIRDHTSVREVIERAKERQISIRIGVNVGSLDPECEKTHKDDLAEAMVQSALKSVRLLEGFNFFDIVVSLKSSDVGQMLRAYRRMAGCCEYPLHLGVTEAGLPEMSGVKSSIGIGSLLADGIGDTIRVSITGDPIEEVKVAQRILSSLRLRRFETNVISCPSCGRCEINVVEIANEVQKELKRLASEYPRVSELTIAVMGCVVNGPGESKHADVGFAGGGGVGVIYRKGKQVRRVSESDMVNALIEEVKCVIGEQRTAAVATSG